MSITTDASLNDFIANALTNNLECSAGTDENDVQQVNMIDINDMPHLSMDLLIGICVVLTVIICSDVIKSFILRKTESLKTAIVYISIIFICMFVMDLMYSIVNNNQYFLIWGIIMLLIPIGLVTKYSFAGDIIESDTFDPVEFVKFCKFGIVDHWTPWIIYLAVVVCFIVLALVLGVFFKYTFVQYNFNTAEFASLVWFLTFSLSFFCIAMASFIFLPSI